MTEEVTLQEIVPGGQTIAELANGKKVFVWGGVPGERVRIRITKKKRAWAEAAVEEVIGKDSDKRIEPLDSAYLSTSPWQIYNWKYENEQKHKILVDSFEQFDISQKFSWHRDDRQYGYRNKMEFSFWWEEDSGLQLSFFKRGSKRRVQVVGSSLAAPELNAAARSIMQIIREKEIDGRQLKSLIVRSTQGGETSVVLYAKSQDVGPLFEELDELPSTVNGLRVVYSNPKSPASVVTKSLVEMGDSLLSDNVAGGTFIYSPDAFFQVNIPMFEIALRHLEKNLDDISQPVVDYYSGVGSIGLSIGADLLVEADPVSVEWAKKNAEAQGNTTVEVVHAKAEDVLDEVRGDRVLIVDPPRAGLHKNVIRRITEEGPPAIHYLSCNPATQARDVALLLDLYSIEDARGYNFFPRTPHIESLVYLKRKS